MNPKQIFGLAGGFLLVYVVITMTNKPHAPEQTLDGGRSERLAASSPQGREAPVAQTGIGAIGFCLPGLGATTLASSENDAVLREMAGSAGWVALSPALFQDNAYASEVKADPEQTPSEASLAHAIAQCRANGLRVLLRPVVLSKDGTRRERFVPADPAAWFKSYAQALSPYVDLAEREHVEMLSIGANYAQIETQPWGELAKQVNERYKGQLTYGAGLQPESGNGGYQQVGFWQELDLIGLEAPAPANGDWTRLGDEVTGWLQTSPAARKVIFTSAGFAAGGADAHAFRAFNAAMTTRPWLLAANWYQWDRAFSLNPSQGNQLEPAHQDD